MVMGSSACCCSSENDMYRDSLLLFFPLRVLSEFALNLVGYDFKDRSDHSGPTAGF